MATFGLITNKELAVEQFIKETKKRLGENNLIKNPFNGFLKYKEINKKYHIIINMSCIYFNYPLFIGILSLIPIFYFTRFLNPSLYLVPFFFISLSLLWTKHFFYIGFHLGLRKAKYKGKIKKISTKDLLKIMALEIWDR